MPINFLKNLGIQYPVIQAPMAGVSTIKLATEISKAGGLGSIAIGALSVSAARKAILELKRSLDEAPFNVNVFAHRPAKANPRVEKQWIETMRPLFAQFGATPPAELLEIYTSVTVDSAMIDMVVETAPKIVSFHFGLPGAVAIQKLKAAGCMLWSSVTNLHEAQNAVHAGMDAIIAQGYEAGGHRGTFDPDAADEQLDTVTLTQMLLEKTRLPVIASGGIMDGQTIKKYLDLGAAAVQLGTAFVACPETSADDVYRAALAAAKPHSTTMTKVISGRFARCLENRFTHWGHGKPDNIIPDYPIAYDAGKALNAAGKAAGEGGYGAHWAGANAHLSRPVPARELMQMLIAEMK